MGCDHSGASKNVAVAHHRISSFSRLRQGVWFDVIKARVPAMNKRPKRPVEKLKSLIARFQVNVVRETRNLLASHSISTANLLTNIVLVASINIASAEPPPAVLWAKQAGGVGSDEGRGVALDSTGNVYVTGFFRTTGLFDSVTLDSNSASNNNNNAFLANNNCFRRWCCENGSLRNGRLNIFGDDRWSF